jgi:hypothetical protein
MNFDHTGAHLPATDDNDRPTTILDELSGHSPATLHDLIRGAMLDASGQDNFRFLPVSKLDTIVTIPSIYAELRRSGVMSDLTWLSHQVWCRVDLSNGKTTTRHKLFAILCLMEKAEEIVSFITEGILDLHLPFEFEHPHAYRPICATLRELEII